MSYWNWAGKTVHEIMPRAVARGWERPQLESLRHLGLEEKSFQRGPSYITLLTDWDEARVVEVVEDRTKEAAEKLWEPLTPEQKEEVAAVAVARGGRLSRRCSNRCPQPMWCLINFR